MAVQFKDMSVFNRRERVGQLMAFKSYFDGSGKEDDPGARLVTLAGYSTSPEIWESFESTWERVLGEHHAPKSQSGSRYFHCKEAMQLRKGYSRNNGWDEKRVHALMIGLFNVLSGLPRSEVVGYSCAIRLNDYRVFKRWAVRCKSIEEICLDHCVGSTLQCGWNKHPIELFFDCGDKFQHVISKAYHRKISKKRTWWAHRVSHVGLAGDSREVYPLQAADLLAWLCNRYYTVGPQDGWGQWFGAMHMNNPVCHRFYDLKALTQAFDRFGKYTLKSGPREEGYIAVPEGTTMQLQSSSEAGVKTFRFEIKSIRTGRPRIERLP